MTKKARRVGILLGTAMALPATAHAFGGAVAPGSFLVLSLFGVSGLAVLARRSESWPGNRKTGAHIERIRPS